MLWLSRVPARRLCEYTGLGPPCKKVWTPTFLGRNSTSSTALGSFPSRTLKYAVSAGLPKRSKNYSSFNFLPENLEKFRSTGLYGAALEGSTILSLSQHVNRKLSISWFEICNFSSTGCNTKKLRRSNLFQLTIFKHGILEGSTSEQMWSTVFPRGWDAR